jgi:hypothetical protein
MDMSVGIHIEIPFAHGKGDCYYPLYMIVAGHTASHLFVDRTIIILN